MGLLLDLLTVESDQTVTLALRVSVPVEFRGVLQLSRRSNLPVEFLSRLLLKASIPDEILSSIRLRAQLPEESKASLQLKDQLPEESKAGLQLKDRLPEESKASLQLKDRLPEESKASLQLKAQLPVEIIAAQVQQLFLKAQLPVEFQSAVSPVIFFNFLGGGAGAPIWWREYPTPNHGAQLSPKTPAQHLHDRKAPATKRWMRRRRLSPDHQAVTSEVLFTARAVARLHKRRLRHLERETVATKVHSRKQAPLVESRLDMRESDEEFMILTGRL
jgi:hypothetical protein